MATTSMLLLGITALLSSSAGDETSQELRTSESDHIPTQHRQGRRTLQDFTWVDKSPAGTRENGPHATIGGLDGGTGPSTLVGAGAVLAKLLEAKRQPQCSSPPCIQGRHVLEEWQDLGEEMSHVQGAVVVRRPDLIDPSSTSSLLAPAVDLDFVTTLQSYFPLFESSLFSRMMLEEHDGLWERDELNPFLGAVRDGNELAGAFLYPNYASADEVWANEGDWHGAIPTVVGMANVLVNRDGLLWNEKDFVAPSMCRVTEFAATFMPPPGGTRYDKVVVLTQHFGLEYYHFMVENMSRFTIVRDILLKNPEIKVAVHFAVHPKRTTYMIQFLELLGIERDRILFKRQLRADLAILPDTTTCGKASEATLNMLRHVLLQALYPRTGGVPPTLPRPVILLIVRTSKRGLVNNDEVEAALQENFPSFDVVQFTGNGTIASQLEAFATASVVVGPHGAGLSNLIVSPLHTPVLEIGPINCPTCFVHLAIKLQHIYARHSGSTRWDEECATWYTPDVDEIINLMRDLFVAKSQVEAAKRRRVDD